MEHLWKIPEVIELHGPKIEIYNNIQEDMENIWEHVGTYEEHMGNIWGTSGKIVELHGTRIYEH